MTGTAPSRVQPASKTVVNLVNFIAFPPFGMRRVLLRSRLERRVRPRSRRPNCREAPRPSLLRKRRGAGPALGLEPGLGPPKGHVQTLELRIFIKAVTAEFA